MKQMLMYHQSTKPECYLEKAKEIILTIFILDSVTDFYLMCHDMKEPTKSNLHLKRLLSTVQVCSSHPVAEGPGTVWKIRAARASCTPSDPPILPSWLLYDSTK